MDTLYYADEADTNEPCEVRIESGRIEVTYERDGGVTYIGSDDGSGHFKLVADRYEGRATLHRFPPDGDVLEGFWIEKEPAGSETKGMWRIVLRAQ